MNLLPVWALLKSLDKMHNGFPGPHMLGKFKLITCNVGSPTLGRSGRTITQNSHPVFYLAETSTCIWEGPSETSESYCSSVKGELKTISQMSIFPVPFFISVLLDFQCSLSATAAWMANSCFSQLFEHWDSDVVYSSFPFKESSCSNSAFNFSHLQNMHIPAYQDQRVRLSSLINNCKVVSLLKTHEILFFPRTSYSESSDWCCFRYVFWIIIVSLT